MASSSKPTGAHYALVVFVLISIVCGLGWLLAYKGANSISELERKARDEQKKADEQTKLASALADDLRKIKELLNSNYSEVGERSSPNTVLWDMHQHIQNYGGGEADDTYNRIIVKLAELKRNITVDRDKKQDQIEAELAQFKQRVEELNGALSAEKTARDTSNRAKIAADIAHQENSTKRDADIAELRKAITATKEQADEERAAAEKTIQNLERRVTSLVAINNKLTAELGEKTRDIFDKANGEVRFVDHVAKRVWVNLGKADGLKPQTTFSVYQKSHSGVGRANEKGQIGGNDIKGGIEITRVVNGELSEARIVKENIYKPIAKGDPIFSPLWKSGRGEAFSIVGIIDLDGDGKDDRELLLSQIRTVGAVIDNEVDDKGVLRVAGQIPGDGKPRFTEKTKYLVIGKIPELADSADPAEMATVQKILGLRKDLEDAARERGVRVISLGDFLSYLGYTPRRRVSVPGDETRIKPRSNSASAPGSGNTSAPGSGNTLQKSRKSTGVKVFRQ